MVIEVTPESLEGWKTYTSAEFGFSFSYPSYLNDSCCNVGGYGDKLIVLADENTVIWGSDAPFKGLGVYVENTLGKSFEEYLNERQEILLNSLVIDSGSNLKKTYEMLIRIGDRKGVLLGGYSYRQPREDVYIPLPDGQHVLCIAKVWGESERFESSFDFDQVLSTFTFTNSN